MQLYSVKNALKLMTIVGMVVSGNSVHAALLNLLDSPLFIDGSKTALVQLVVERDNKLFFEAYPTYEDIDGDGELDIRYKPDTIDYYGYFESTFCYKYFNTRFKVTSRAVDKKCLVDDASWSGDYLNYITMTRMDVMLRALYGGRRIIDSVQRTVLRRAFVPWENHTWGSEYTSVAVDGFDIREVSSLNLPTAGKRHHIATNNIVGKDDVPYLRIRQNRADRIWHWVDKERVQGDGVADFDFILDVEVCNEDFLEPACKIYPNGKYKPVGILHEYGENDQMYFGLLTGSYQNNLRGGILRKTMSSFARDEVNKKTGRFKVNTKGIIHTLDALQIPNEYVSQTVQTDCGWITDRTFRNGECRAWGNPVAEMMYEGMRYMAGYQAPTPMFVAIENSNNNMDEDLGLEAATWDNPYADNQPYSQCSSAYQLVISDPSPSFDGDQLPGSYFNNFTDSQLLGLDVGAVADIISLNEDELPGFKFIGQSGDNANSAPTPKNVTTFKTIRGISPEAPHRQGSYYAPSVSYFGHQTDLQPTIAGKQNVGNFTLALGSQVPTIDIKVNDADISFAPFGKSVRGCGRDTFPNYKPSNSIVNFTVEEITNTSGSFRVSFEDMEQGADNDLDALIRYEYAVVDDNVDFTVTSVSAAGCFQQHLGYTVSGTTADGVYLVVRDADTSPGNDVDYELDVPPGATPGSSWNDGTSLPLTSTIRFTPSTTPTAKALKSPLWYAAKWGGFDDTNEDSIPQKLEWDSNEDGEPDNYFKVTDPSKIAKTLRNTFNAISEANASASAVGVSGGSLSNGARIYEASFRSGKWYGELTSRAIDEDGVIADAADWDVNAPLTLKINADTRKILTYKPSTETGIAFRWPADSNNMTNSELDPVQVDALSRDPITDELDLQGATRMNYLRGNAVDGYREREKPMGDIINSKPQLVGPPVYFYPDDWGIGAPETDTPYSTFGKAQANRQRVVYVGANDGMLHAFNAGEYESGAWSAGNGSELFAYVPSSVYTELPELTSSAYRHKYYVNATPTIGDAIINGNWATVLVSGLGRGGQGIFALDVTSVSSVSEDAADDTVMWEFTDKDDEDLGYTFTSPMIVRMHNGKWAAVFGNGYNATEPDGATSSSGKGAIFIVDLESGVLIKKMFTNAGSTAIPNGVNAPTTVDLDGDNIVDVIYTGDLAGELTKYDVSSTNPDNWSRVGDSIMTITDEALESRSISSQLAVGSHPTGEGVIVYTGTGKYLEPSDHQNSTALNRLVAVWDKDPFADSNMDTAEYARKMVEQEIISEASVGFDTNGDGNDDTSMFVRKGSAKTIDWDTNYGWYMNLKLNTGDPEGEQIIAKPVLRDGRLIVSTHIPTGSECSPDQLGWLMILDAASGAMMPPSIDLNDNGSFESAEKILGVRGISNPLAAVTIATAYNEDRIITNNGADTGAKSIILNASTRNGRVSWRELEP